MQEPRILDSTNVANTALINVEDLFDQQRDRFDYYDAAAAVIAAQKLKNKLKTDDEKIFLNLRGATAGTYDESVGSSSEETGIKRPNDESQQTQAQNASIIPPQYQNQYQSQQRPRQIGGATKFITTSDEYCLQQVVDPNQANAE